LFFLWRKGGFTGNLHAGDEHQPPLVGCSLSLLPTGGGVVIGERPDLNTFLPHQFGYHGDIMFTIAVK